MERHAQLRVISRACCSDALDVYGPSQLAQPILHRTCIDPVLVLFPALDPAMFAITQHVLVRGQV